MNCVEFYLELVEKVFPGRCLTLIYTVYFHKTSLSFSYVDG